MLYEVITAFIYPFKIIEGFKSAIENKKLLSAGADVNYKDKYKDIPLVSAIQYNKNPEVVKMLIKAVITSYSIHYTKLYDKLVITSLGRYLSLFSVSLNFSINVAKLSEVFMSNVSLPIKSII